MKLTIIGATKGELHISMYQKKDIDSDVTYERGINIPDGHMGPLSNSKWLVQSRSRNVTIKIIQITENCN